MAFIVEDGSVVEGANSYVEISFADEYFTDLAVSEWSTQTEADKQAALINASEYATLRWGRRLTGVLLNHEQALAFPRYGCVDSTGAPATGVPKAWKQAVCNYALQHLNGALYPDTKVADTREVESESVTIGPIRTAKTFSSRKPVSFPKADALARRYVVSASRVIRG